MTVHSTSRHGPAAGVQTPTGPGAEEGRGAVPYRYQLPSEVRRRMPGLVTGMGIALALGWVLTVVLDWLP